jgi:hypothetical protein
MVGSEGLVKGNRVSLCLVCSSEEEIETSLQNVLKVDKLHTSLKEELFGTYGDLTDVL